MGERERERERERRGERSRQRQRVSKQVTDKEIKDRKTQGASNPTVFAHIHTHIQCTYTNTSTMQ